MQLVSTVSVEYYNPNKNIVEQWLVIKLRFDHFSPTVLPLYVVIYNLESKSKIYPSYHSSSISWDKRC